MQISKYQTSYPILSKESFIYFVFIELVPIINNIPDSCLTNPILLYKLERMSFPDAPESGLRRTAPFL